MENNMFCFQCQETAKGFGCTLKGVCGKNATTARTMDLLLFVVRGISVVADQLRQHSLPVEKEVDNFIVDAYSVPLPMPISMTKALRNALTKD